MEAEGGVGRETDTHLCLRSLEEHRSSNNGCLWSGATKASQHRPSCTNLFFKPCTSTFKFLTTYLCYLPLPPKIKHLRNENEKKVR